MSRAKRILAAVGLAFTLITCTPTARAQQEAAPAEGESKGDPLYGYVATSFLAALVLFIVGKSARR
jgi:hypothetical protein